MEAKNSASRAETTRRTFLSASALSAASVATVPFLATTTDADWTSAIDVGNVTSITVDISKDNVQFGLRAVDQAGHLSPVALPQVAA
jgi:hypothetical protein